MSRRPGIPDRRRQAAAPLLLAVYLAAGLVAPAAHLFGHRDDHTHGPVVRPSSSGRAFQAPAADVPRRGHARERDVASALAEHGRLRWPWAAPDPAAETAATPAPAEAPHAHDAGTPPHAHPAPNTHTASARPGTAPHSHGPADGSERRDAPGGHGAGSAAHFALAVVAAPPPVVLPLPASTRRHADRPPVIAVVSAPRRLQPARGPPVLV